MKARQREGREGGKRGGWTPSSLDLGDSLDRPKRLRRESRIVRRKRERGARGKRPRPRREPTWRDIEAKRGRVCDIIGVKLEKGNWGGKAAGSTEAR